MRAPDPKHRHPLLEAGLLALILAGYVAVLWAARALGGPWPWLLPSVWLLVTSTVWLRVRPMEHLVPWGGARAMGLALLCGGLAVGVGAFAHYWPPAVADSPLLPGLALVLLVPLAEELFFRGVMLDQLARAVGRLAAVAVGGLVFGLLHQPQGLMVPMTVLALVLGAAALASRSVLWAVALHLAWNALAVLRATPPDRRWVFALAAVVALAVVAVVGLLTRERSETG